MADTTVVTNADLLDGDLLDGHEVSAAPELVIEELDPWWGAPLSEAGDPAAYCFSDTSAAYCFSDTPAAGFCFSDTQAVGFCFSTPESSGPVAAAGGHA